MMLLHNHCPTIISLFYSLLRSSADFSHFVPSAGTRTPTECVVRPSQLSGAACGGVALKQYVTNTTTVQGSNLKMNINGTRHGSNHHHYFHHHPHHSGLLDLPWWFQLPPCTPSSPFPPSVLLLATVTHLQQQQQAF